MSNYYTRKCPECKNIIRPSKIEFGKWVCKKCYRIFKEEDLDKNGNN